MYARQDDGGPGWTLVEDGFDPRTLQAWEGLFTLGSGLLHVRGSLEEPIDAARQRESYTRRPANVSGESFRPTVSKWGTYVPGLFGRHPLLNNQMINLPWFLGIHLFFDGMRFTAELANEPCAQRRTLHLDCATLVRDVHAERMGKRVTLRFERFVSAVRPHLCVQRVRVCCDQAVRFGIGPFIDAEVRTNGHDHFETIDAGASADGTIRCRLMTDAGDRVEVVSRCRVRGADFRPPDAAPRVVGGPWQPWGGAAGDSGGARVVGLDAVAELAAGQEATFEKHTEVRTSRDAAAPAGRGAAQREGATYDVLHAEHAAEWARRWRGCDVVIEGDDAAQRAMRVALYHLLRSHVPDPRVAVDAKGFAGDAYWGRFFWDTEMFLLPFHLYTDPVRARTLVEFRVRTLSGARANAARYGYRGARYAWESDADGVECCPNWQYADHEVHVTADVVYGLAHAVAATTPGRNPGAAPAWQDPAVWEPAAAQVVVETARYWLERIDWTACGAPGGGAGPGPGARRPVLLGVMGPDEYTPICNNNAFTNRMVAFALDLASRVGAAAGAAPDECAAFAEAASGLAIPRRADGLVLQCDEFERLAEPDFDRFWIDRTRPLAAQISQERLYRTRCIKQADVLMLMALFPDEFRDADVTRAWDFYVPYTTHDSSLSPGVHAIVAARLGRLEEALHYFRAAAGIDLDVEHGGAREGIHVANAGALWQAAVFGFAGLRTALQSELLCLQPRLPPGWTRLAFPLRWRGTPLEIDIRRDVVRVTNGGREPLAAELSGQSRTIAPRERVELPVTAERRGAVPRNLPG